MSYGKILQLGHKFTKDIFDDEVVIQEKVDGSFGLFCKKENEIEFRSKGKDQTYNTDKLFIKALETVKSLKDKLTEGYTYFGEVIRLPKHNIIKYGRCPKGYIILFDIATGPECFLSYDILCKEATRLGLEVVPQYFQGKVESASDIEHYLDRESVLGGSKIEGVVIKNFSRINPSTGKILMAKLVSAKFKEVHKKEWKKSNPSSKDILNRIIEMYGTEARYMKAVQHLREEGRILDEPKDIGLIVREVQKDIFAEHKDEIKDELFKWAKGTISRGFVKKVPSWYKKLLIDNMGDNNV